ncbi:MAG: response regulator [Chthoniobacterales bacterium]
MHDSSPLSDVSLKILLVENHADTLLYLQKYLESLGYKVHPARDMETALSLFSTHLPEILISDIGLPDGDGWELFRRVCAENPASVPYGVAMSGYAMQSDTDQSFSAGYRHHLIKPFVPEDLEALLKLAAESIGKKTTHGDQATP